MIRRAELVFFGVLAIVVTVVFAGAGLTFAARHQHHATSLVPAPPTVLDSTSCKPPAQHPDPVLLLHGTFGLTSWGLIGPALAQRGYCVFTIDYGSAGTLDIVRSAHQLARDVDHILALTGARRVAIVGHSEGGMMPRYYIERLGGAAKVSDLIGLSPSNHGTTSPLALGGLLAGCTACGQQLAWGSVFLQQLNAGDEAPPPVDYTVIQTRWDAVVIPYQSAFLAGPRARVTDVTLQDRCPADTADHLDVPNDPVALQWVEDALAVDGPANPGFRPAC
ncbi:MAG: lipase [Solirubrobacterales bacterium]|nr:lipase [Solirubrobacterales bacterium]